MSSEQSPGRGRALPSEEELLREARALMPPVGAEPRPGFAARVALRAAEVHAQPAGAPWWRLALGGGALAAAAGAIALISSMHHAPASSRQPPMASRERPAAQPGEQLVSNDRAALLQASGGDLQVAQRLELYEDLTLLQNEDALEELEVVEVLHQLHPKARP